MRILALMALWALPVLAQDDRPPAILALDGQCKAGDAMACSRLGASYRSGDGVRESIVNAALYYSRACAEGAPAVNGDCRKAGEALALAQRSEQAAALHVLLTYLMRWCEEGRAHDCNLVGLLHVVGVPPTIEADDAKAATYYERGCKGGAGAACANLGDAFASASGVGKDLVAAARWYKKACDRGAVQGCASLAAAYRADPTGARETFRKACGDDARDCSEYQAFIEGIEAGTSFRKR